MENEDYKKSFIKVIKLLAQELDDRAEEISEDIVNGTSNIAEYKLQICLVENGIYIFKHQIPAIRVEKEFYPNIKNVELFYYGKSNCDD